MGSNRDDTGPDKDSAAGGDGRLRRWGRQAFRLAGRTLRAWQEDDAFHWGGAIAYYAMISLAPLVVLAMAILGDVFGSGAARDRILDQVRLLSGPRGADLAASILDAGLPDATSLGGILTVLLLLFGATAVFVNLQGALNRIWSVRPDTGFLKNVVRSRIAAFFMVLALGGLVVASVVVGTAVGWLGPVLTPLDRILPVLHLADLLTSFLLLWFFVGMAFWVLPDVRISWRDVWAGAMATALLLLVGRQILSSFLARNALSSLYGTAGSVLLLLLWTYYSAQVFFLGAELTQVWAEERGRSIQPEDYASRVEFRAVETDVSRHA
jgi:membrane protein